MLFKNTLYADLKVIKESLYDGCGLGLSNLKLNTESVEYGACSYELNGRKIEHRISKITPTKIGQFVTIWKRNKKGVTEPFDMGDDFDFIVITSRSGNNIGQFIFSKSVLCERGVISRTQKGGKRGIRVYPPWDIVTNKQAEKTQHWQVKFFVTIQRGNTACLDLTRELFTLKG